MGERKNLRTYLLMAVVFISYCPCPVLATTYYVNPGESIQDAIDGASYGDTIEVSAGTYVELITLKNGVALIGAGQSTTTIDGNDAGYVIYSVGCDLNTVLNGFTIANGSATYGGGMFNIFSNPTVTNCTFSGNGATERGGGMYNNNNSRPTVTNCILWGNTASSGGNEIYNDSSTAVISYCDIAGGYTGTGNIDDDPLFVDPNGPDGTAGTEDDNLRLSSGSPCIDAAKNSAVPAGVTTDLDGNPRFLDDPYTPDTGNGTPPIVDMGAYEYTPPVIYVDEGATGANNGIGWTDAYNYLADALNDARLVYGYSILVAEGVYRPDEDTANPTGTGLRTDTFGLMSGVALYGGFPTGGSDFAERDPNTYETILSGDLSGDDVGFTNNNENSYHVVTGSGTDPNAILDGFTITAGNADGSGADMAGGGMINRPNGNPTITNCTFSGNSAEYGGGIRNFDHSSPTLTNCHLKGNSAWAGGGMFNWYYSTPTLTNCTFSGNTASADGGGMFNHRGSDATAINCTFSGNSTGSTGGGMFNYNNSPTLTNCTFSGNSVGEWGGGMYNVDSSPTVTNCILWGNSDGGGMDESSQIYNNSSTPVIHYCCVQGWTGSLGGVGNIGDDPLFKDADGPDDIPGTEDDNLELAAGSPCIDAGDNSWVPADIADLDGDANTIERVPLDLAGNARFTDDPVVVDTGNPATGYPEVVDMGAYERYEFCGSGAYPYPPGDVSGPDGVRDCYLDFYDFAVWAAHWLEYTGPE